MNGKDSSDFIRGSTFFVCIPTHVIAVFRRIAIFGATNEFVIMKKILCILLLAFSFCMSYGQNKQGALKFLDIPIDGSETQMILKLKRKGFSYDSRNDLLQGQFNGQEVNLYIHTNHNVVDRIYVAFPSRTAQDVKDEYNRLLSQLRDNPKYKVLDIITPIPQEEDLYYEMNVEGRLYETAVYYFD